jgi:PAS domain S-box-containing protein
MHASRLPHLAPPEEIPEMNMEQARQILADLRIHQIELRGQNEELRRTQQELEESRQRYFKLYDLAPVGYCTLNARGVIQEINLTLAALLQMDRADLVGKNLTRFIHPQDYEVYVRFLKSLSASRKACTCEVRMFRRDQGHIQARLRASTEHDAKDQGWMWLVVDDISEYRRAEQARLASEHQFHLLADNSPLPIFIQTHGCFAYVNKAHMELYGARSPHDLLGASVLERCHPRYHEASWKRMQLLNEKKQPVPVMEQEHVKLDGTVFPVEMSAVPFHFEDQDGALTFVRDLTEQKQEEAMRRARDRAEAASLAKTRFLANMTHELRTPMNAILGFAGILQNDPGLTLEQSRKAGLIHDNGHNLLRMINEILDISKLEAGQVGMNPEDFSLVRLLEDVVGLLRPMAWDKGLDLRLEYGPGLPGDIHADQAKLRQILTNLLGNALKYTQSGHIGLKVSATGSPSSHASNMRLVFEILDSGLGIHEDEVEMIFEPFQQTEAGRKAGGTGLGLAISREYAQLMGGSLTVSSRLGSGSNFRLEIPVRPVPNSAAPPERPQPSFPSASPPPPALPPLDVPEPLTRDLLNAMAQGDVIQLRELVAQTRQYAPQAAPMLTKMADDFAYDKMTAWLQGATKRPK